MVRRGRELRQLPIVDQAWSQGQIGAAQVDLLIGCRSPATEEALARDEQMLVTQAALLPHRSFERVVDYWKQLADPDGAEGDDEKRRGRRDVYLEQSFGGMWFGQDHPRPDQRGHRGRRARTARAGDVRSRLVRGQGATRFRARRGRPGPDTGTAAGRRPGRDGQPQSDGPGRWPPAGASLQHHASTTSYSGAGSASWPTGRSSPRARFCPGSPRPTSNGSSSPPAGGWR